MRTLSATHKDLSQLVNDSRFRHDLDSRINVIGLNVPTLRERAGDLRIVSPCETAGTALPSFIEDIERAAIQQALQENRYNKTKTAAALGITFRALRYKLKKLGID